MRNARGSEKKQNEPRKNYCLYVHVNRENGKKYVGITGRTPKARWYSKGQGYKGNKVFYAAIQKYGWDNFDHLILMTGLTLEQACEAEVNLIREFNSLTPNGYNVSPGGALPLSGYKPTGEDIKKQQAARAGYKHTEETKQKISNGNKGKHRTEQWCVVNAERQKGIPKSAEAVAKMAASRIGKHLSDETRRKISMSCKGRNISENTKRSVSMARKGLSVSDCVRERISKSLSKAVAKMDKEGRVLQVYSSAKIAERENNLSGGSISKCCRGKLKSSDGYMWKYINHEENCYV